MTDDTVLKIAEDVTFQSLGEEMETVILSLTTGTLYSCNQTTEAFLKSLNGSRSFAESISLLLEEFAVGREELANDLREVAAQLLESGLIKIVQS